MPIPHLSYVTFEGIQEYKKVLGFPYLEQSCLEPYDQPEVPEDSTEADPLIKDD